MKSRYSSRSGFSLIEIMVVVTIMGLLASIVGPRMGIFVGKSYEKAALSQMKSFQTTLELYKLKHGSFPTTRQGLEVLCQKKGKREPLLSKIPLDPWGNPYIYKKVSSDCEITSYGAGGKIGGEGEEADIVMSF